MQAVPPDPNGPRRLYNPEDFDFRLKPCSAAIDKGVLSPSINGDFTGRAPDLGAHEMARPVPIYGPEIWPTVSLSTDAPHALTDQ